MNLTNLINMLYSTIRQGRTDIFREYEQTPLHEHTEIYATVGTEKITFENQFMKENVKRYETRVTLRIRVLGYPHEDPLSLYYFMDQYVLSPLSDSGYYVISAELGTPCQDNGLRRLVLEGRITVCADSEVEE